jgi:hypothetical protein
MFKCPPNAPLTIFNMYSSHLLYFSKYLLVMILLAKKAFHGINKLILKLVTFPVT